MTKLLLSCLLVLFANLTLRAADYLQLPGHFGGFGSDEGLAVADEFVLSRDTKVRQITWWGENVPNPASKHFKIRLFSDNGGQPGRLLLEITKPSILKQQTGDFLIRERRHEENLYPEYQYTLVLTRPFTAKAGVKYWLSVVSESVDGWTWEMSGTQGNLGVQRSIFTDSINGPWTPYYDNTAFVIGRMPLLKARKPLGRNFYN